MIRREVSPAGGHRPTGCGALALALAVGLAGCAGDGSDIGPRLPPLPPGSCKAIVFDDAGRGVVAATVAIDALGSRGVTGRNGRTDLFGNPVGRFVVRVDGRAGAATNGDQLAELRVAATISTFDLPAPFYLPDLPAAAAATLLAGTQTVATVITSIGGGRLRIPAGASVGTAGGESEVNVRLGELSPPHLPGDLPEPTDGATLFGRGLFVSPAAVTFSPAAEIELPDDVGAGGAPVALYHLDQQTGEWQRLDRAVTAVGGALTAASGVDRGGLYAFGVPVPATSVVGRVVAANGSSVADATVIVDHRKARSGPSGSFVVAGVPATRGDGAPRAAAIELIAGGFFLPARFELSVPVDSQPLDLGDLTLDTVPAGNVRVQRVERARPDALRTAGLSTSRVPVALATLADANGQVFFEDVPADFFGYQAGRRFQGADVLYGQSVLLLGFGRRWFDTVQFLLRRPWFIGTRQTLTYACDAVGTGPIAGAAVIQGDVPEQGFVGRTQENGTLFVTRAFQGRATVTLRSEGAGRVIVQALTVVRPDADHLEFPLQRVLRAPLGAFDRHGTMVGTLAGADPAREHELRTTRRLELSEWWNDVTGAKPLTSSLPVDIDPAVTHGPFQVGIAAVGGNVAAVELASGGGPKTLQKVGIAKDIVPPEGVVFASNLPLDLEATQVYPLPGAATGNEPLIDLANLSFALALEEPGQRVVDVVRDLRGNLAIQGGDLSFALPPLSGPAAGRRWLALLQGDNAVPEGVFSHRSLIALPAPPGSFAFPPFPTILAPANGATVPAAGLLVSFELPAAAVLGSIELRSETATELLRWQAFVPRDQSGFTFVRLPAQADQPLLPGRTYTLTISAYYGSAPTSSPDPYRDLVAFQQSIDLIEAGLTQLASHAITITTE